ncbi:MAG: hypothetical protein JNL98_03570 [Bryobacterales bacterium]|nr:hypothetical protein [Bryobacterales bacterium]
MPRMIVAWLILCFAVAGSWQAGYAGPLLNGNFETGNLSGWTVFTTANGSLGAGFPQVVTYDTGNTGTPSLSAQFRVGQVTFNPGFPAGGGLFQNVTFGDGSLTITASIAAQGGTGSNFQAGLFQLLLDGVVVASHDFGAIDAGAQLFSTLNLQRSHHRGGA